MKNLFSRVAESGYDSSELVKGLERVFAQAQDRLYWKVWEQNPDMTDEGIERDQAYRAVLAALPEEEKHLLGKMQDIENHAIADEKDVAYMQGYIDCVALLKLMNLI